MRRTQLASTFALLLASPGAAFAQSYGMTQTSGSFVSIAGTGSLVSISSSDDDSGVVSLPQPFTYFGSTATEVYPSTNGLLAFDTPSIDYSPDAFPSVSSPNGIIAGYWADLSIGTGGIYSQTSGGVTTIEWSNVSMLSGSGTLSFQIKLYHSTGNIEIVYGPQTGSGSSAGIGMEDATGSDGVGLACSPGCSFFDVPDGTLVRFTPGSGPPPMSADLQFTSTPSPPSSVTPGMTYQAPVTFRNAGSQDARNFAVALAADFQGSPSILAETSVSVLGAGSSRSETLSYTVPVGTPQGSYTLAVVLDPYLAVTEGDEGNNQVVIGVVNVGGGGGSISITTSSLPSGTAGSPYSFQFQQTGASSPTWSIVSGSLPAGLSLSSSGRISGTPSGPGSTTFMVMCQQSGLASDSAEFLLEVLGGTGFRLTSTSLPQATVGTPYNAQIMAAGGQAPYAFQALGGTPSWLRLVSDGSMSGTPTAAGHHEIRLSVFDAMSASIEGIVVLDVVESGPLALDTTQADIVPAVVNTDYDVQLRAHGGMGPYTFQIVNGNLPAGLALNGDHISGRPSAAGTSRFDVQVTDAASATAHASVTLEVIERTELVIDAPSTIQVRPNADANFKLNAHGGVPPYQWQIVGSLPDGLRLELDTIRGTPTSSRAASMVTLRLTDAQPVTVEKMVSVEVNSSAPAIPSGGGGGGSGTRRGGGCAALGSDESSPLALLFLASFGLFLGRRSRRA